MKEKQKSIIRLLFLFLIIISLIISTYYIYIEEERNNEKIAIVTFYPTNLPPISITCEIALTSKQRSEGLMFREELSLDEGMLFVFENPKNLSFWMKNVLIPLDIIFLNETGYVINVESADIQLDATDLDLIRYLSLSPAKYVVEINQGLCLSYGIIKGISTKIEYH